MSLVQLIPAIYGRLKEDPVLQGLGVTVHTRMRPDNPEGIKAPIVIVDLPQLPDARNLHGAAADLSFEIETWGYGKDMLEACATVADRIAYLMLSEPLSTEDGSISLRLISETGINDVPEQNPKIIHLQERFTTRFWSQARVQALTS